MMHFCYSGKYSTRQSVILLIYWILHLKLTALVLLYLRYTMHNCLHNKAAKLSSERSGVVLIVILSCYSPILPASIL